MVFLKELQNLARKECMALYFDSSEPRSWESRTQISIQGSLLIWKLLARSSGDGTNTLLRHVQNQGKRKALAKLGRNARIAKGDGRRMD